MPIDYGGFYFNLQPNLESRTDTQTAGGEHMFSVLISIYQTINQLKQPDGLKLLDGLDLPGLKVILIPNNLLRYEH